MMFQLFIRVSFSSNTLEAHNVVIAHHHMLTNGEALFNEPHLGAGGESFDKAG